MVKIDHNILRIFSPLARLFSIAVTLLHDGCLSPVTNTSPKLPFAWEAQCESLSYNEDSVYVSGSEGSTGVPSPTF